MHHPRCPICGRGRSPVHHPACSTECLRVLKYELATIPHDRVCSVCSRPLRRGTQQLTCKSEGCEKEYRNRAADEKCKRESEQQGQRFLACVRQVRSLPEVDQDILVVSLQHHEPQSNVTPRSSRSMFRGHVESLVEQHWACDANDTGVDTSNEAPTSRGAILCSVCRGHCCRFGGTSAYLNAAVVARYRRAAPEATEDDFINAYVSCIPEHGFVGHCVMLTPSGCALPRHLRATICNRHKCDALMQIEAETRPTGDRAFAVALTMGPSGNTGHFLREDGVSSFSIPGEAAG